MFTRLFSLMMLSAAPLLAEISYIPAQPAGLAPEDLPGYRCEIMELLDYNPSRPDEDKRTRALQRIRENKNDCVNDSAGHDGFCYTPLYVACQLQDEELVQALLAQGADACHPCMQGLMGKLPAELENLLRTARSAPRPAATSPEEWERRFLEQIGGKVFWNATRSTCAAVTQQADAPGLYEIWCLRANSRGRFIPVGVCIIHAPHFNVDEVVLHRGIMKTILGKPGVSTHADLHYQLFHYARFDFSQSTTAPTRSNNLGHPVSKLPMYTKLLHLVES